MAALTRPTVRTRPPQSRKRKASELQPVDVVLSSSSPRPEPIVDALGRFGGEGLAVLDEARFVGRSLGTSITSEPDATTMDEEKPTATQEHAEGCLIPLCDCPQSVAPKLEVVTTTDDCSESAVVTATPPASPALSSAAAAALAAAAMERAPIWTVSEPAVAVVPLSRPAAPNAEPLRDSDVAEAASALVRAGLVPPPVVVDDAAAPRAAPASRSAPPSPASARLFEALLAACVQERAASSSGTETEESDRISEADSASGGDHRRRRPAPVVKPAPVVRNRWTKGQSASGDGASATATAGATNSASAASNGSRPGSPSLPNRAIGERSTGEDGIVRGPFSSDEDALIIQCVQSRLNWREIAERVEGRNNKQCRERYINHLAPGISKSPWTPDEDRTLFHAQALLGNRWAEIAKRLPGRAENSVKNRFKSADFRKNLPMLGLVG